MTSSASRLPARVRVPVIVGWAILAMSGPVLEVLVPASTQPEDWQWPLGLLAFAPAAAVILIRRPGNKVGMVLAAGATGAGVIFIGGWAVAKMSDEFAATIIEHTTNLALFVSFWAMISLLYLFPTGIALGGGWRTAHRLFSVILLGLVPLLFVVRPGPMQISGIANPFAIPVDWLPAFLDAAIVILPIGTIGGFVALVVRFRRSSGIERAQLKLFVLGAGFVICLMAIISVVPEDVDPLIESVLRPLVIIGFWALPVAIVAAVLRYRLYDIDRIASRTVTYVITVSMLGVGYLGSVIALQAVLPFEGGIPVAVSTLATASVSLPLVRAVQRFVDRRFFRSRYDAQEVVAHLTTVLRSHLDLPMIAGLLTDVVAATFEPVHMSLWIPDDATSPQRRAMLGG